MVRIYLYLCTTGTVLRLNLNTFKKEHVLNWVLYKVYTNLTWDTGTTTTVYTHRYTATGYGTTYMYDINR
jgi:hypothetical protein